MDQSAKRQWTCAALPHLPEQDDVVHFVFDQMWKNAQLIKSFLHFTAPQETRVKAREEQTKPNVAAKNDENGVH